ncbi:MAG: hypothetical protein PVH54_07685 [Gammaproteobacteria bacterium]|jgi:hypothetical protein
MSFVNLAVVTALCLQLPVTRIYGVIGVGILLYFRPVLSLVLFQSDNSGYYGHGTHGKTRKDTIPV